MLEINTISNSSNLKKKRKKQTFVTLSLTHTHTHKYAPSCCDKRFNERHLLTGKECRRRSRCRRLRGDSGDVTRSISRTSDKAEGNSLWKKIITMGRRASPLD